MNRDILSFYMFGADDATSRLKDEIENHHLVLIDSEHQIDIMVAKISGWFSKAYFSNQQEADLDQHARGFNCGPNLN